MSRLQQQALHAVLQAGWISVFSQGSGRYLSHMAPEQSKNIFLRLGQYHCYELLSERNEIARAIVNNKIQNQNAYDPSISLEWIRI